MGARCARALDARSRPLKFTECSDPRLASDSLYTYTPPYTHLKYTPRPKPATARAWTLSPDSASPPADIYLHLLVRRPQRELLEYPHYLTERLQGKPGEVAEGSGR